MIDTEIITDDWKNYPRNLFLALTEKTELEPPASITADNLAGLHYVLSLLDEREREIIRLRYEESHTQAAIGEMFGISGGRIRQIEQKVLRKLRTPPKWNYIKCGISGNMKRLVADSYSRGYTEGYKIGYKNGDHDARNGVSAPKVPDEILNLPIETLGLSVRAFNCLKAARCDLIGDVVRLDEERIMRMRNLGKVSADEITRSLHKRGIKNTAWDGFLLKTY